MERNINEGISLLFVIGSCSRKRWGLPLRNRRSHTNKENLVAYIKTFNNENTVQPNLTFPCNLIRPRIFRNFPQFEPNLHEIATNTKLFFHPYCLEFGKN